MSEWKTDHRQHKDYGDSDRRISLDSQTADGETAHLITFGSGAQLRVLPDPAHSGRIRSAVVIGACSDIEALSRSSGFSWDMAATYLIGMLAERGITWERVTAEPSVEEWLAEWLEAGGSARQLLDDLAADGFEIVRRGAS